MKKNLINILACPICKSYPLELLELETREDEVINGVLTCSKCGRYYPIIDAIPSMLPDDLREPSTDLEFLSKWKEKLPEKVLYEGLPHHLNRG